MPVTQRALEIVREEIDTDIRSFKAALPFTQCETVAELMSVDGIYTRLKALSADEQNALLTGKPAAKAAAMKLIGPQAARGQLIAELEDMLADPAKLAAMRQKWGF